MKVHILIITEFQIHEAKIMLFQRELDKFTVTRKQIFDITHFKKTDREKPIKDIKYLNNTINSLA